MKSRLKRLLHTKYIHLCVCINVNLHEVREFEDKENIIWHSMELDRQIQMTHRWNPVQIDTYI